jgi:hypothetical protein
LKNIGGDCGRIIPHHNRALFGLDRIKEGWRGLRRNNSTPQ